ncbi:hypothetical protein HHK36_031613 [Tetracentron sinense]|uniref:EGF-like domain-containing protein n=1 Tax=Tetracentron sinense TaxID=13715 RepID=A0A834Y6M1_TETSI|nr:hypothetical protein HHK36_031613 [Tetracentron sinense]
MERSRAVLDWAVGLETCKSAQRSSRDYACGLNSKCNNYGNGNGYRCKCIEGFEGNPYLPHGCQGRPKCDQCGKDSHTISKCYKLHGFAAKKTTIVATTEHVAQQPPQASSNNLQPFNPINGVPPITQEQYQHILSFLIAVVDSTTPIIPMQPEPLVYDLPNPPTIVDTPTPSLLAQATTPSAIIPCRSVRRPNPPNDLREYHCSSAVRAPTIHLQSLSSMIALGVGTVEGSKTLEQWREARCQNNEAFAADFLASTNSRNGFEKITYKCAEDHGLKLE